MTIALGVTIGSNAYIESITNVISGQLTQFDKNMMMNLRLPRMLVLCYCWRMPCNKWACFPKYITKPTCRSFYYWYFIGSWCRCFNDYVCLPCTSWFLPTNWCIYWRTTCSWNCPLLLLEIRI